MAQLLKRIRWAGAEKGRTVTEGRAEGVGRDAPAREASVLLEPSRGGRVPPASGCLRRARSVDPGSSARGGLPRHARLRLRARCKLRSVVVVARGRSTLRGARGSRSTRWRGRRDARRHRARPSPSRRCPPRDELCAVSDPIRVAKVASSVSCPPCALSSTSSPRIRRARAPKVTCRGQDSAAHERSSA